LLIGPLRFTPVNETRRRGYAFEGLIALYRLLVEVLELRTKVASPAGLVLSQRLRLEVVGLADLRAA
jgi:hypothetical protein